MTFEGAVLKEQGVSFAIIVVKEHVLNSSSECNNARSSFQTIFPRMPIILSTQNKILNFATEVQKRNQILFTDGKALSAKEINSTIYNCFDGSKQPWYSKVSRKNRYCKLLSKRTSI